MAEISWACQLELENRDRPGPLHPDTLPNHCTILIDWLFEVFGKYELSIDTQLLTLMLLDRVLATEISRCKLQLAGIACCHIACMYNEVAPPDTNDFVWICSKAYTHSDVSRYTSSTFAALDYNITTPTTIMFFRMLGPHHTAINDTGEYIILLMAIDRIMGSRVAIAALVIAQALHADGTMQWPDRLAFAATADEAFAHAKEIITYMKGASDTSYFKSKNKMVDMPLFDYIIQDHRENWAVLGSSESSVAESSVESSK